MGSYEAKIWSQMIERTTNDLLYGTADVRASTKNVLASLHQTLFGGTHTDGVIQVEQEEYAIRAAA